MRFRTWDHPRSRGVYLISDKPPGYRGDHPRSRGVYASSNSNQPATHGSSPLARGLPVLIGRHDGQDGIIPARAGFTHCMLRSSHFVADHPRSRGVYFQCSSRGLGGDGSSPLARGLRPHPASARLRGRIIPARAGFTPQPRHHAPERRDHPRSRGVYRRASTTPPGVVGSSPLARGLHLQGLTASHR